MPLYSVAQAKNELPRLLDKAIAGEDVIITRRGIVVAELRAKTIPVPLDDDDIYERLRRFRESQSPVGIKSADLIRQIRDEGY